MLFLGMRKIQNPATAVIALKLSSEERAGIMALADREKESLSSFCRQCLVDRLNFERATGKTDFLKLTPPDCSTSTPAPDGAAPNAGTENKPNAARIAPPAEISPKGGALSTAPASPREATENK